tara:strand:- start:15580 stop:15822 length:243 start_codon:yes stop_codon:yes gene_type:complete
VTVDRNERKFDNGEEHHMRPSTITSITKPFEQGHYMKKCYSQVSDTPEVDAGDVAATFMMVVVKEERASARPEEVEMVQR